MIRYIIALIFSLGVVVAFAAPKETDRQFMDFKGRNVLENPGFENGLAKWANSGGTKFELDQTTEGIGSSSLEWDADLIGDTVSSTIKAVETGLLGRSCQAEINYLWAGTDDHYSLQVWDGSSEIAESLIKATAAAVWETHTLFFTCPTSGNWQLRIYAENASATEIRFDNAWLGSLKDASAISNVTATLAAGIQLEAARLQNTGTGDACTVLAETTGDWLTSGTGSAAGICTWTINTGVFSGNPSCVCGLGENQAGFCAVHTATSTSMIIRTLNSSAANTDLDIEVHCIGPK